MSDKEKHPESHTFEGGMQRDTALWVIPNNCYYYALNIHILKAGSKYIVTNVLGNTEIPFTLPAGENFCLGSHGDTENNKFYWANWNENNFHGWYMYDYTLNKVTPILLNLTDTDNVDILQFKKRSLILMIDVIKGGNGNDLIYWCDGQVNQKKFNIQKALDKSSSGYGTVITPTDINAYKLAANAPVTNYFTDTTRDTNFVYGHLYKASLRHWFDDGEKNNWSEFSNVARPVSNGFTGNPAITNINNTLQITVETGPPTVKQIEIALKEGLDNFVSVVVLDKAKLGISDDSTYVYNFYNDNTSYSGLVQEKVYRAYSFMPRLAALQAFCQNAIVYGKGVEGFPVVPIKLATDVLYSDLFVDSSVTNGLNSPSFAGVMLDYAFTREGKGRRRNSLNQLTVGNDVKEGNKFELFGKNGDSDNLYFSYIATNSDSAITVANAFKQLLVATDRVRPNRPELPDTDIWTNEIDVGGNVTFKFLWKGAFNENATGFTGQVNPVSFQTLKDNGQSVAVHKSGDSVRYAVIYWNGDTFRSNAYTDANGFVRNDFITQSAGFKKIEHRISLLHQPPVWATHWELVRTAGLTYGDKANDYIQILIQKAIESQSTTDVDYVDLVIGSLYTYQKMHPNTVVKYDFQKNDRVRLIKKDDGTFYPFTETIVLDFKEVGTSIVVNEDVTTNNTSTVTIGGTTTVDNIGRFMVIDGVEREILSAPTGTTYTLDRTFGTAQKYTSFQIVDKRGLIRVRKPLGFDIEDNSIVEVYRPVQNVEAEQKNFFLFGKKFAIQGAGTALRAHTGNIQNQDPANLATTPAIVSVTEGTSYVRNRQLPTNNMVPGTQVLIDLIEDNNYSDSYESSLNNNGKIAPEDDGSGERRFGSRLRYSNNYIEGTRLNGLNDFDNEAREDYNDPWGDFMLLKYRDRLLYAYKQLRVGYIGVLNSIITTSDGNPSLTTTTKFLNQFQTFSWEGGIGNHPESYASEQNWQWFLSPNSGTDCRIGGDGILPTSQQFGLSETVRSYIDLAEKYNSFIFGGIDRQNRERILAFEPHKPYIYRGGFNEANWKLFDDNLPENTVYEITTQPVNGANSAVVDGVTTYTPDNNFVGSDPSAFRWSLAGGGFSPPKPICLRVDDIPIPPPAPIFYNSLLSGNFTKDDCGPGYHGSVVVYEVPAQKYNSPFSQVDANQQAANEAAQFGPIKANELGTCILNAPNAFAFTDLTGLEISTLTESGAQVISGPYAEYVIVVAAGTEYQVNGGTWTAADGIIPNGASVKLRKTTSESYETPVNGSVTIGGVTDTWTLTTKVAPILTIAYSNVDDDPIGLSRLFVDGNLLIYVNYAGIATVVANSVESGTFQAPLGAVIQVIYGSEPARFPWPPNSSANILVTNGATTIHNETDNVQANEMINYTFTLTDPNGSYSIAGTTQSTATGLTNRRFLGPVNAPIGAGEVLISLVEDYNNKFVLGSGNVPNGQTASYGFHTENAGGLLSLTVTNNSAIAISYVLVSISGPAFSQTQTIAAGASYTFTNVPKQNLQGTINAAAAAVSCGVSSSYSGGEAFPTEETITLGSATGIVVLNFQANQVPDKFEVWFDGVKVIDTGYRGDASQQSALNAELASRGLPPETITGAGTGTASFVKSTATTTAIVKVYAPMSGTAWSYTLGCPSAFHLGVVAGCSYGNIGGTGVPSFPYPVSTNQSKSYGVLPAQTLSIGLIVAPGEAVMVVLFITGIGIVSDTGAFHSQSGVYDLIVPATYTSPTEITIYMVQGA